MPVDLPVVPFSRLVEVNPKTDSGGCHPRKEVSFIGMTDVSEDGYWATRNVRLVREVSTGYTSFAEGDVLFAKITPCMENGKGAHARNLVSGLGFGSTEFHVLRASEEVSSRFVYYWSQSPRLRTRAEALMTGSAGQQRVPSDFFQRFSVPLLPLPEQRRIAEILDTVDETIRQTEQVIAKLEQVKKGLLHDLLTRGIDENGELRDPERHPERFKSIDTVRVPEAWQVVPLGAITRWLSGGTPSKGEARFWGGEIPWVSPKDMKVFRLADAEDHVTLQAVSNGARLAPESSTLIVVRGMILAHSFPVCYTQREVAFNQDVKAVVPGVEVDGEFLAYWFTFSAHQILGMVTESTHGTKRLDPNDVTRMAIALPGYDEQRKVVQRMNGIEARLDGEKAERAKLRLLKHALMDDLLTGRIRVPVPEDSPA